MSTNPYQSPQPNPNYFDPQFPDPVRARQRVMAPAVTLLVLAALTAIARVAGLIITFAFMGAQQQEQDVAYNMGAIGGNVIALMLNVATIAGAYKMTRLESIGAARTAAIISVIPICSPCLLLGIPFGIWALVVLADPPVQACFKN
jgi:hypothetical protein